MPVRVAHQVPAAGFDAAVTDIDDAVTGGDRRPRRDEGLDPDQQRLAAGGIADLRHVVVGGDHIAGRHPPLPAEKIREIEFGGLAAVVRIDAHDPRRAAFDGGEQDLALAGGPGIAVRPRSPVSEWPG